MHTKNIKVSILIPTYNRCRYVREALNSAISQSYSNVDIVVSDNCSLDGTCEYLDSIKNTRVRVLHQRTHLSMCQHIWTMLDQANGKYSVILSDDDLLDPNFIDVAIEALEGSRASFFTSPARIIDQDGIVVGEWSQYTHGNVKPAGIYEDPYLFLRRNFIPLSTTLFPTNLIKSGVPYRENIYFDWTWWNFLALSREPLNVGQAALGSYRVHRGSVLSNSSAISLTADSYDMYKFLGDRFPLDQKIASYVKRSKIDVEYWQSRQDIKAVAPFLLGILKNASPHYVKKVFMRALPERTVSFFKSMIRST